MVFGYPVILWKIIIFWSIKNNIDFAISMLLVQSTIKELHTTKNNTIFKGWNRTPKCRCRVLDLGAGAVSAPLVPALVRHNRQLRCCCRCGLDLIKGACFSAGADQTQPPPEVPVPKRHQRFCCRCRCRKGTFQSSSIPSLSLPAQQCLLQLF